MNVSPEQLAQRGRFITTYSGAKFFVEECNIWDIPIVDIAHALSMNCRFNGHLKEFYSVAEHSVIVSRLVPEEYALWGLLHDATEAFVPDMPRPFKKLIYGFKKFEDTLANNIAKHFNMPWPMPDEVHYIDTHIVGDEARRFFPDIPDWVWLYDRVAGDSLFYGLPPKLAEDEFMERFNELT